MKGGTHRQEGREQKKVDGLAEMKVGYLEGGKTCFLVHKMNVKANQKRKRNERGP